MSFKGIILHLTWSCCNLILGKHLDGFGLLSAVIFPFVWFWNALTITLQVVDILFSFVFISENSKVIDQNYTKKTNVKNTPAQTFLTQWSIRCTATLNNRTMSCFHSMSSMYIPLNPSTDPWDKADQRNRPQTLAFWAFTWLNTQGSFNRDKHLLKASQ